LFRLDQQNVHQTTKEAQSHLAYLNALAELRDSSDYVPVWDGETQNFYVCYDTDDKMLVDTSTRCFIIGQLVWYATKEAAEQAIKEHEAAFKTYFGVQE